MATAATIRALVETKLENRFPSALTPVRRFVRPVLPTGIPAVDALVGGLPVGAITELTGPDGSGRTSLAMAFLANIARQGGICAWVDASDTLHGESAAATGVDLSRLLWVRCGVREGLERADYVFRLPEKYVLPSAAKPGLHGGGFGPHQRTETKGLSGAMGDLFGDSMQAKPKTATRPHPLAPSPNVSPRVKTPVNGKPWTRIEQALKATDLVLQAGGFSAVVLDLAGIAPAHVSRIELSVWFRYRAAVERSQTALVLLTNHPCAKSAGELLLRLRSGQPAEAEGTFFKGVENKVDVERRRFTDNIVSLRKPPQSATAWKTRPAWVCR